MASISFLPSSNPLSFNPISDSSGKTVDFRKRASSTRICASSRRSSSEANDQNYYSSSSRLVDENMIVLRKRIHEMKMVERNYEPPSDWNEWEKKYYTSYDSFVCQALGVLQSQMMNTRPSLALGMMGLILLSVPMSTTMILFRLMEIANGVLAGVHIG
ncbi:hypothetical protein FEM48_Zijuj10G0130400 [Ziziphus jujuba var. spinosa]|uniref:Uncharacterized protein n=1 Tax=Ziziphus jujuba var. spinosa TaxID=714518 RepID=A0A978UNJ2_ZIZJJ|nr:hypothetical protein FEM48_Zijuj10G0130400 [Ziziphus jujuba var. spinosa]